MKNILKILLLICLVISCLGLASTDYTKVIHNTDPEAKCLDGSAPMIYLHEGGDTKNLLFYFVGGGACLGTDLASTLENCYKRSKGRFGTSTLWEDSFDGVNTGILDTRLQHSRFANWTKIVILYCDGAFHQGNNKLAIKYKDTSLYFRGAPNTRSHIQWAHKRYNLTQTQRIIVSGGSAGGMSTYLWVDYFRTLVPNPKTVFGVADSGAFYDPLVNQELSHEENREIILSMSKHTQELMSEVSLLRQKTVNDQLNPVQYLMRLSNTDEKPPNRQCSDILQEDEIWKCIFIQFTYPTFKYPILFVESSYDSFVIQYVFGFKCLTYGDSGYTINKCGFIQQNAIEVYRAEYLERFLPNLLKWGHSIWTISCSWHAEMINGTIYDSNLQKVPKNDGRTIRNAVETFVFDSKRIQSIDFFGWPANTPCAY